MARPGFAAVAILTLALGIGATTAIQFPAPDDWTLEAVPLQEALTEAMIMAGSGILAGLAGAFALTRLMQSLQVGVSSTDAATYAAISLLLLVTALAASYLPVWRATRVDLMVALRYE